MAGQQRRMEGNEEQKQAAARDAREQGKQPSEVRATTGASKQRQEAPANASHQEKLDTKHEGKLGGSQSHPSFRRISSSASSPGWSRRPRRPTSAGGSWPRPKGLCAPKRCVGRARSASGSRPRLNRAMLSTFCVTN